MSKTKENLEAAFAGESMARNKYTFFAKVARKEGYHYIAKLFEETAINEMRHANDHFKLLDGIGDTIANLQEAIDVSCRLQDYDIPETDLELLDEIMEALEDLLDHGCSLLTLGQYLQPSKSHLEVAEFITPDTFDALHRQALAMGFIQVASGPFVRSSYHARELFKPLGAHATRHTTGGKNEVEKCGNR